jgi:hypothetical protein
LPEKDLEESMVQAELAENIDEDLEQVEAASQCIAKDLEMLFSRDLGWT